MIKLHELILVITGMMALALYLVFLGQRDAKMFEVYDQSEKWNKGYIQRRQNGLY